MALYDLLIDNPNSSLLKSTITTMTRKNKILSNVLIELTPICNFKCPFCYARKSAEQLNKNGEHVVTFNEWKPIFDQLSEMKVSQITFTGGECTLHKEFCNIYSYCYDLNFDIAVFSNGSHLTDEMIELFTEKPPRGISITIYAANPDGYEVICGNRNYYDIVLNNIKKLKDNDIVVSIKQTISKDNITDAKIISDFANSISVPYHFSTDLVNFRSCNEEKIEDNSITDIEKEGLFNIFSNKDSNLNAKSYKIYPRIKFMSELPSGIQCGAGNNSAYINYKCELCPCVTIDSHKIDLKSISLEEAWTNLTGWAKSIPPIEECYKCLFYSKCLSCFAFHYNDTHEFGVPSPRLCWKRKHPEKAEELMKYYEEHGYIMSDMLDD